MKLTAFLLSTCLLLVAACSDDKPASQAAAPQPSTPAAVTAAAVPAEMAMDAGGDDEELVYDPIDAAKLDNQWWKQYSASGD